MYQLIYCEIRNANANGRKRYRCQWLTAGMIDEISSRPGYSVRAL